MKKIYTNKRSPYKISTPKYNKMSGLFSVKKYTFPKLLRSRKYKKFKWQGHSGCVIYISQDSSKILKTDVQRIEIENIISLKKNMSPKYKPFFLLDYIVYTINHRHYLEMKYYEANTLRYKKINTFPKKELQSILSSIFDVLMYVNYNLKFMLRDLNLNNILYLPNTKHKIKFIDYEALIPLPIKNLMNNHKYTEIRYFLMIFFSRKPNGYKYLKCRKKKVDHIIEYILLEKQAINKTPFQRDTILKQFVIDNVDMFLQLDVE